MSYQIEPVGNKLLVKKISAEETLETGIVLPDVNNADMERGLVVAVSQELQNRVPNPYNVGEVVLYQGKRGIAIFHNKEAHVLVDGGNGLEQGDVWAIIK